MLTNPQATAFYGQASGGVARLAVSCTRYANPVGLLTLLAWGSRYANCTRGFTTMNQLIPTLGGSQCRYVRIPVKPSLIARISRMVKKAVRRG